MNKTITTIVGAGVLFSGMFGAANQCNQAARSTESEIFQVGYNVETTSVDQVFRDHDGWRVYSKDETGKILERKYLPRSVWFPPKLEPLGRGEFSYLPQRGDSDFLIFKDLSVGEAGYMKTIQYTLEDPRSFLYRSLLDGRTLEYKEIHLPSNFRLTPGLEQWGSLKHRIYGVMSEVE